MDLNGRPMADRAGAAKRRRERRLRSWLRHERMTVAAELSAALHHSRDGVQVKFDGLRAQKTDSAADGEEVVHDAHDALRGQKTPPPGVRPGSLCDPGPQRSDRTVRRSPGDSLPTLALPILAGSAGEVVDSSSLRFLTASALKARREEEEKEKKKEKEKMEKRSAVHVKAAVLVGAGEQEEEEKEEEEEADASDLLPPLFSPSSSSTTAVARSRLVFFSFSPRAVFFVVVGRPEMLGIKAVLDQKNSYALFLDSGMCKAGISGTFPMCLFPGLQAHDARHQGRYGPDGHFCARRHRQLHGQGWFFYWLRYFMRVPLGLSAGL